MVWVVNPYMQYFWGQAHFHHRFLVIRAISCISASALVKKVFL